MRLPKPTTAPDAPLPLAPFTQPWPLHDSASTRAWEQQALAQPARFEQAPGLTGGVTSPSAPPAGATPSPLMQAAGLATARLALALAPHAPLFQVQAGPGNNGGDGWVAATVLHQAGRPVQVVDCSEGRPLPRDAHLARQQALQAGVQHTDARTDPHHLPAGSLQVDALLGLGGQTREAGRVHSAVVDLLLAAERGHTVLAVDLPSGLHADTGQCQPGLAVLAHHTLSLLTLKPGLFTGQGRDHAGQVWLHRLGTADLSPPSGHLSGQPALAHRRHSQHKGSFGDVAVLGGAPGMAGALVLAARAAACGGAGRVFAYGLDPQRSSLDEAWPELMFRPAHAGSAPDHATVVAGCGGGQAIADHLPALLNGPTRLVLDADALNTIARSSALQQALAARHAATVLTPHPLEAARLLGTDTTTVQAYRISAAQTLARRFQAVVLLKGSGTVLASPAGTWCINPTGNALLASAGTGDVLAGFLGGLWSSQAVAEAAVGLPAVSQHPDNTRGMAAAFQAACAAAWWHGTAADQAWTQGQRHALRASALVDALGRALGEQTTHR